jgi:hypothetical protein
MARIPQYSGGNVQPIVRPGTRVTGAPSADQASLPGRQLQGLAGAVGAVGDAIGDYAAKEQEKINKVRFNDAYNQALNEANRLKNEMAQYQGAEAVKGINGRPLTDHYRDELQKAFSKIGEGLSAPDLKDGFGLAADDLAAKFMREADTYFVEQGAVYTEQVRDATVIESFNQIATAPSSPLVSAHMARARDAITDKLRDSGLDGEALDQQVKRTLTQGHTNIIDQLNKAGNYAEAQAYFDRHKSDFMEADAKAMQTAMDDYDRDLKVMGKADAIWAESGGDYGVAIGMAAKVTDPRERADLEARINTLKTQGDAAQSARDDADLREGMGFVVAGQPLPAEYRRRVSPLVLDRIQTEQRTRALWEQQMATSSAEQKAALKQASQLSFDSLKVASVTRGWREIYMTGPENWPERLATDYARLSPEHKADIELDIATKKAGGGTVNAADAVIADVISGIAMYGPPEMKGKDFSMSSKSTGRALEEERAVLASIVRQAEDYSRRSGGAPITPQDRKIMIARAFREANPAVYPYAPGDQPKSVAEAAREAMAIREDLRELLGREPTQQEINQIAQEMAR